MDGSNATEPLLADDLVAADIAMIGDFSASGSAWRVENEIRIQAESGYRTALVHVPVARQEARPIHPDIHACVTEGLALPVDPSRQLVRARLAVVRDGDRILRPFLAGEPAPLPRILAEKVIALAAADLPAEAPPGRSADVLLRSAFGATTMWAGESEAARNSLRKTGFAVIDEVWHPSVATPSTLRARQPIARVGPVIGCAGPAAAAWWAEHPATMRAALEAGGAALVRLLLLSRKTAGEALPEDWEVLRAADIGLRRFLGGLDFFVYTAAREPDDATAMAIAAAIAHGLPTILDPALRRRFGTGGLYPAAGEAAALIGTLHGDPERYREAARRAAAASVLGPEVHRRRLQVLLGEARREPVASRPRRGARRLLFVSSNGVGLGHLTRLLAIARRCPPRVQPVVATMSQGFSIAQQLGFPVEYIPFVTQSQYELAEWDAWLARQLAAIIDFHRIDGLVFDGVMPFDGLVAALAARRHLSAVWVRRPMWRKGQESRFLKSQKHFNLVIEPGEVAGLKDDGATTEFRKAVVPVPPIRLLDEGELLDRATAAARIGLDPGRLAVLIQLGAGTNRDVVSLIDRIVRLLAAHPQVQPVIAEWKMASLPAEMWPGVVRLRAFPLSRYYAAFDFTISAAGYNSFNEIVSFGLPAILLANPNQVVDDQPKRASHAEEQGAAIVLPERDAEALELAIQTLLTERARWFLAANCKRIALPNGAQAAADAIVSTV